MFVGFGMGMALAEALGCEDVHGFLDEARGWIEVQELFVAAGGVAGFFGEFAAGGGYRLFTAVDAAGYQLPQVLGGGVAVLADEQDAAVVENGEDYYGARVDDNVASDFQAAGFDEVVAADVKDRAVIEGLLVEYFFGFAGGVLLEACFWHRV